MVFAFSESGTSDLHSFGVHVVNPEAKPKIQIPKILKPQAAKPNPTTNQLVLYLVEPAEIWLGRHTSQLVGGRGGLFCRLRVLGLAVCQFKWYFN